MVNESGKPLLGGLDLAGEQTETEEADFLAAKTRTLFFLEGSNHERTRKDHRVLTGANSPKSGRKAC